MARFGKKIDRAITIEPSANNGYIVRCGCGTFVFQSTNAMLRTIKDYCNDPEKVEAEYNLSMPPPQPDQNPTPDEGADSVDFSTTSV